MYSMCRFCGKVAVVKSLICGMVGILLTCEQNCRISLRVDVWAHQTSLIPSLFYGLPAPSQGMTRSCICVLVVSILSLFTIFVMDFGIVPTVWYFVLSIIIDSKHDVMVISE